MLGTAALVDCAAVDEWTVAPVGLPGRPMVVVEVAAGVVEKRPCASDQMDSEEVGL